ncbi:MAG: hypothetical protein LBR51_03960 [Bacteroidales bacterium]|jgi:uncharacterized coiled-coil protein SlyX|nr:hypothetical protein [Bacteroidales bacterium]
MKKGLLVLSIVLLTGMIAYAQKSQQANATIEKHDLPGFILLVEDCTVADLEAAFVQRFEKEGHLKVTKKIDGYKEYGMQIFPKFGNENLDIYMKVAPGGKKKEKKALLTLVVTKGNLNPLPATETTLVANIHAFLAEMVPYVRAYCLQSNIADLNKQLAKHEKELKKMQGQKTKVEKTMDDLNRNIGEKNKAIEKTKVDIETANAALQKFQ